MFQDPLKHISIVMIKQYEYGTVFQKFLLSLCNQTRYDRISAIEFKLVENETNKYSRTKSWRSRGMMNIKIYWAGKTCFRKYLR